MSRLAVVRAEIGAATRSSNRPEGSVRLVAVSKFATAHAINDLHIEGQRLFGESRAQELVAKARSVELAALEIEWHFIGRLQTNKVKSMAPYVAVWQSVDRHELVDAIAQHAPGAKILLQMRLGPEPSKGGADGASLDTLLEDAHAQGLAVVGLMGIPPFGEDPTPYFDALVARAEAWGLPERSIGMSGDFQTAIAHGATLVRIGTALFGRRPNQGQLA